MFRNFLARVNNSHVLTPTKAGTWKYYAPFASYPKKLVTYEATKKDWFDKIKGMQLTDDDSEIIAKRLNRIHSDMLFPDNSNHYIAGKTLKWIFAISVSPYILESLPSSIAVTCHPIVVFGSFIYIALSMYSIEQHINDIITKYSDKIKEEKILTSINEIKNLTHKE